LIRHWRDFEIRQVIDICAAPAEQPDPDGEAGVGKTAVVEGFASGSSRVTSRVAAQRRLADTRSGLLQAGAGVRGVRESAQVGDRRGQGLAQPVILFIDEAHAIYRRRGSGQGDAANLLKPALARGSCGRSPRPPGRNTRNSSRPTPPQARFQVVKVDEPDEEKGVRMMRGLTGTLEKHTKFAFSTRR